jgi:hypothetical protein
LPRWEKGKKVKEGSINWTASIGYKVTGIYKNIDFEAEIINYNIKKRIITFILKNEEYTMNITNFQACKFGKILNVYTNEFKIKIGTRFKDEKKDLTITDRKKKETSSGTYALATYVDGMKGGLKKVIYYIKVDAVVVMEKLLH